MHLPKDPSVNKAFGDPAAHTLTPMSLRKESPTSARKTPLLRYPKTTLHNQPSEFSRLLEVSTGFGKRKKKKARRLNEISQ